MTRHGGCHRGADSAIGARVNTPLQRHHIWHNQPLVQRRSISGKRTLLKTPRARARENTGFIDKRTLFQSIEPRHSLQVLGNARYSMGIGIGIGYVFLTHSSK
jgi:hypothetical protein